MDKRMYLNINNEKAIIIYNVKKLSLLKKMKSKIANNADGVEIYVDRDLKQAGDNKYIQVISSDEMRDILRLYQMYEFTDKIIVISDNYQYPNMFNYIRQGILTEDELVDALFNKIG